MNSNFCSRVGAILIALLVVATVSARNFYVPGAFQGWDPPTSQLMVETPAGSGIYETTITGLIEGSQYGFKILEDLSGDGANWSNPDDPEITTSDSWLINVGMTGESKIILDTNDYTGVDDFLPATNRVIIDQDISTWNALGDFMTEAGGAMDWVNDDPLFAMVDQGGGLFSLDVTIDAPGMYQYRAVNTGTFLGIGTDQRRDSANNLSFTTFEVDQDVTFLVDTSKGAISVDTIDTLAGDTNGNFVVELIDFDPIRDNWLTNTFIRSEGDLVPDGIVDILDFREWKDACIDANCASSAQIRDAFLTLPEPTGGSLLILALTGLAAIFRRR